ncbi:MAG: hypothetical protein FJX75_27455 [Armatimonadetes bacterium]|nr:hypothetical protein [Armatimonadota bacterium]
MRTETREPDCVRWKRLGAERIRRETEGMTREEVLAWWRERELELKRLREERKQATSPVGEA